MMGVVISSVVAGGPAVLEDLETPYAVIQERRVKQQEKQRQKPRLRRQKNQLEFESNKTVRYGLISLKVTKMYGKD